MSFEDHVREIKELWAAYNRGDYGRALAGAHREGQWQTPPDLYDAKTGWHYGHQGIIEWVAAIWQAFDATRIDAVEFARVDDNRLIVTAEFSGIGKQSGIAGLTRHYYALVTMRDGLCWRMELYSTKAEALEAAAAGVARIQR